MGLGDAEQNFANAASNLLVGKGRALGAGQRATGEIWGSTLAMLGDRIPKQVQEVLRQRAEQQRQAQIQSVFQKHGGDVGKALPELMQIDPVLGNQFAKEYGESQKLTYELLKMDHDYQQAKLEWALNKLGSAQNDSQWAIGIKALHDAGEDIEGLPLQFSPEARDQVNQRLLTAKDRLALNAPKAPEPFTLSPGQVRFGPDGKPLASVPEPEKPAGGDSGFTLSPGQVRYGPDGKPIASAPRAPAGAGSRMWVSRNGQLIRISESEYQPGDLPASSREQGRPVTSGDANRVAELNSSLSDLKTLRGEVAEVAGATGPKAQAGAALPNFITAWTGIGTTAKQKQAVIDRVKQVIGKALEGGVLRKEDEYKYAKILPTIGDAPDVVKTKLDGLEQAIFRKRDELLSSLDDAGYDVSGFQQRLNSAPPPSPAPSGATRQTPTVGSIVTYGGKRYTVKAIKNGQAELEPVK